MTRLAALACAAALFAGPAAAQSWCGNDRLNTAEQMICADEILGRLDGELNALWRERGGDRAAQTAWLQRRNACGSDIFCIEDAYRDRIAQLTATAPRRPAAPLRPWCSASRLNPTEQTICAEPRLADMDAALVAVYGAAKADDSDREQVAWLRGTRDACGRDEICIGNAYLRRIIDLGRRLRENGR